MHGARTCGLRCGAHYTHAKTLIFLSQASYVANRRHIFAIARAGNLPAANCERHHGVLETMRLPLHTGRRTGDFELENDRAGENRDPVSGGVTASADCRTRLRDGLIT
jgi:hypothetical protein